MVPPHHRGGGARLGRPWPDGWDGCCDTVTCPWRVITLGAAIEAVTPLERGAPAVSCGKSTGVQTCPCQTEGHKRSGVQVELSKWVFLVVVGFLVGCGVFLLFFFPPQKQQGPDCGELQCFLAHSLVPLP